MSNVVSFTDWVSYPHAQIRVVIEIEEGTPIRFLIQLEYKVNGEWQPVVRFDHNPQSEHGHDIVEEGLHMDIYRDGEVYREKTDFPKVK